MSKSGNKEKGLRFIISKLKLYSSKEYITYRIRSVKWFFIKQRVNDLIYQFDKDVKVKLYTKRALSKLIYCGQFEKDEFDFMAKYVKPDSVVYDIGANIGLHSIFLANIVGEKGVCYSFEPIKETFDSLNENVAINNCKNIETFNIALSDKDETLEMYKSTNGFDAWNSLGGVQKADSNEYNLEQVRCVSLDSLLRQSPQMRKPDFIKMDTEGWELHVLKGSKELLRDFSPVLMIEFSQKSLELTGTKQSELHDFLNSFGYKLYQYDHSSHKFSLLNRDDIYEYINAIASKTNL